MDLIQAAPIPPFATRIPSRRREFKSHPTLAAAKLAAVGGDWFVRDMQRMRKGADGVFSGHVHLYCLEPHEARYRLWVTVQPRDRRSDHQVLMPITRVAVPGAGGGYSNAMDSKAMKALRRMARAALADLGLSFAQLREKALSGRLNATELSLWGLISGSGGFPEAQGDG